MFSNENIDIIKIAGTLNEQKEKHFNQVYNPESTSDHR